MSKDRDTLRRTGERIARLAVGDALGITESTLARELRIEIEVLRGILDRLEASQGERDGS